MASTGYPTPYANLNQWVESDKVRMEDFNQDNERIDEALEQLATTKVDQTAFDSFAGIVEENLGELENTVRTYSAQADYSGGVFTLTGLPEELPETFSVCFTAPKDYLSGDLLRIGGENLELYTTGLHLPAAGTFAQGALVNADVDLAEGRAYLPAGSGSGGGGGKRFEVFDLPASRVASEPLEWEFENFGADIAEVLGVQTVGDESYIFAPYTIYIYNHLTGEMARYTHSFNLSSDISCMAYTIDNYVCFDGGYEAGTTGVAIDVNTKRIQQIDSPLKPTCIVNGGNGSAYAFGGLNAVNSNWVIRDLGVYNIYTAKRGPEPGSMWDEASVVTLASQRLSATYTNNCGPRSAAAQVVNNSIWYAVHSYGNGVIDSSRYTYDMEQNTIQRMAGKPAFCADTDYENIPYGFAYKNQYYAVHGRKISAYDFAANTVDETVKVPDAPVDRPNLITVYGDTWVVFTAQGIYRMAWQSEEVPADKGGVLELYAGQQYRAEKEIIIPGKITFRPQWQTAAEDLEIKKGEYNSPTSNKVYVRTR